ncbi:MAG TPA: hypothetical protein VM735_02230 [Candidatus Kapabacteria bacterium]|nr:hypothetical protein [Candidatus Kapabacteria bacterium]
MNDAEPRLYPTVIREMIRHENDVTNHRIMWLLIGQGLIANAYVSAGSERARVVLIMAPVGILLSLSAFVILYKSYQARGYLQFLGEEAKRGQLREENLPIFGWPKHRIKGWRSQVWVCPWVARSSDLLEPYFFLPGLMMLAWLFAAIQNRTALGKGTLLLLIGMLVIVILFTFCFFWVRSQTKYELLKNEGADD